MAENRIQNMVVTIDKIKNVVCNLQEQNPPVYFLEKSDIFKKLWGSIDKGSSVVNDLYSFLTQFKNQNIDVYKIIILIQQVSKI